MSCDESFFILPCSEKARIVSPLDCPRTGYLNPYDPLDTDLVTFKQSNRSQLLIDGSCSKQWCYNTKDPRTYPNSDDSPVSDWAADNTVRRPQFQLCFDKPCSVEWLAFLHTNFLEGTRIRVRGSAPPNNDKCGLRDRFGNNNGRLFS